MVCPRRRPTDKWCGQGLRAQWDHCESEWEYQTGGLALVENDLAT